MIKAMHRDLGIIIWTVGSEWNSEEYEVLKGKRKLGLCKKFESEILQRKQKQQSRSGIIVDKKENVSRRRGWTVNFDA